MKAFVQLRRFWLTFGVIIWTLLVTVARAIRGPNEFALSQWLLDYRFGFMKRGLMGSIATLFSNLLGTPVTYEFVGYAAGIIAGLFYLTLLAVAFRLLQREGERSEVLLALFVFITSPFIVMNAHVFGYFDALLYLLTMLTLALIFRGRLYLAVLIQVIAVLSHESYLVIGFPAACLAVWMHCEQMDWKTRRHYYLVQCVPVAAFGVILLVMALTDTTNLHDDLTARFVGAGMRRFGELFARLQLRGFGENFRRNWELFPRRLFNPAIWKQLGPAIGSLLLLIYLTFQIRLFSWKSLILFATILVPLGIHCVAFDAMRISTYTIASAFLVYWVLSESPLPRAALPLPRIVYVVAVLTLVYQAVMHVTLMDRQTDRFSIPLRLLLYAPMLMVVLGLIFIRRFPIRVRPSMTSKGSFKLLILGSLFICSLPGCSPRSNSANLQDPNAALNAANEALKNDESLSEEVVAAVLGIDSDDYGILVRLARTAHAMGHLLYNEEQTDAAVNLFLKAGAAMQKVEQSGRKLSSEVRDTRGAIYYDQACAFSLLGQPDKALVPLRRAVEVGYGDPGMFVEDRDLNAVLALPEYPAFYAELLKFQKGQLAEEMQKFESYPLDFDLTDLDGKQLSLSDMRGKVVMLDFWATWCRPCLMTMPHLNDIYQEQKSNGLEVIGLDYEGLGAGNNTVEKVKSVLSDLKIQYPCAIGDEATEAQVPDMESIPTLVFIDRAGKVRFQLAGAHSRDYLMLVLEPLLAEPAPEPKE